MCHSTKDNHNLKKYEQIKLHTVSLDTLLTHYKMHGFIKTNNYSFEKKQNTS